MTDSKSSAPDASPVTADQLSEVFKASEKSPALFRIGAESEKFGVHSQTGRPLWYGGDFSVCQILTYLESEHGWTRIQEVEDGPVLGLKRGGASITLEPSVQFELSGDALPNLHLVEQESHDHLKELHQVCEEMKVVWLTTGFHPLCRLEELPWVPKQRYPIMRSYLPAQGAGGLNMMQRTCTTQGNFDWSSEDDAMKKLVVSLKLAPLVHAWFANAPFSEGKVSDSLSLRGRVWTHMDPSRSGLVRRVWEAETPRYSDYVEWALDAGMFLIRRGSTIIKNTGQTFRDYMQHGFEGHFATESDWKLHLTTLFPEVRLKNTLEVRSVDALPPPLSMASLAVWTGILYDQKSLDEAHALLAGWDFEGMEASRPQLIDRGLHAPLFSQDGFYWAKQIAALAQAGLSRRARLDGSGQDETRLLAPALEVLESRKMPAERALERYAATGSLIAATQISLD